MLLNTLNDINRFNNLLNRMFFEDSNYRQYRFNETGYESDVNYNIVIPAAGVKKEDIELNVTNNVLNIKFKRELPKYENAIKVERSSYTYNNSFQLPDDVNIDEITAQLENGVLNIVINKKEEQKPKKIEINVK